jgi:hypothetical protein
LKDKNYKVAVKKVKKLENEVWSIGFPESVFDKLKIEFVVEDFKGYNCCANNVVFDNLEYQNWRDEVSNNQPNISKFSNHQQIIEQIKNYPLANKTSIEVFAWVASLQSKI